MKKKYIIIGIIILTICFILAYQLFKLTIGDMIVFTEKSPLLTVVILIGLYCLKSIIMVLPLVLLYITAGIIFQTEYAIIITYLCLIIESSIGFIIGKKLGHKKIERIIAKNKRLSLMLRFNKSNSLLSVIILRLIPGPPFELCSMFLGASGVDYVSYIVGSLLAITPGMIPVILMGTAINDPLSLKFILPLLIKISLVLAIILYFKKTLPSIPRKTQQL
ncbi:MAG: VTT domain-containing protein [Clostridiales bacterium]|jgi:uncharacterized membrane protein YdjX (TVP38/TMEM64 family)|nr:VTT domain-containing protein [Clostridiales bacterium]